MKVISTIFFALLMISCQLNKSNNNADAGPQISTSSPVIESQPQDTRVLFNKEDIKGIWTSGETENASFKIEEDSILFVDALVYVKYQFKNDTLSYLEDNVPFFKTRVIKADHDSLVTINQDGIRRLWRFKD